jgi:ribokinase
MELIYVVGSYNLDLLVRVERFPEDGETVFSKEIFSGHGGKGSNQAVSASRLGGKVKLTAAVGNDDIGKNALLFWDNEKVDRSNVKVKNTKTGNALIIIDKEGRNRIIVDRGANFLLSPEDVDVSRSKEEDILLTQMEIKENVVFKALKEFNGIRILNPAPSIISNKEIFNYVDILTPNEVEFKELAPADDIRSGLELMLKKVRKAVVLTMGDRGVILATKHKKVEIKAVRVKALDTTGAGDVFNASLAYALEKGMDLDEAVGFANAVAGLSVTKEGALGPKMDEVELFFEKINMKIP